MLKNVFLLIEGDVGHGCYQDLVYLFNCVLPIANRAVLAIRCNLCYPLHPFNTLGCIVFLNDNSKFVEMHQRVPLLILFFKLMV